MMKSDSQPGSNKRACIVYVKATAQRVALVRERLEANGYETHAIEASLQDATAAQAGTVPHELECCLSQAELCVFLLPEVPEEDEGLLGAGALADRLGKRVIAVISGNRTVYPPPFEDHASSIVRTEDDALDRAICGTEVWQQPDGTPAPARRISHVKCQ